MTDVSTMPVYDPDVLTGTITLRFGGNEYHFSAPTFGGLRVLDEYILKANEDFIRSAVAAAEAEIASAPEDTVPVAPAGSVTDVPAALGGPPEVDPLADLDVVREKLGVKYDQDAIYLGWWRTAAGVCGVIGFPASNDDLPGWLANAALAMGAQEHWREFPTRALGVAASGATSSNGTR